MRKCGLPLILLARPIIIIIGSPRSDEIWHLYDLRVTRQVR